MHEKYQIIVKNAPYRLDRSGKPFLLPSLEMSGSSEHKIDEDVMTIGIKIEKQREDWDGQPPRKKWSEPLELPDGGAQCSMSIENPRYEHFGMWLPIPKSHVPMLIDLLQNMMQE